MLQNLFKNKNTIYIFTLGTLLLSIGFFLGASSIGKYLDIEKDYPQNYQIISPAIPEKADFCSEGVPLNNYEVKERLDRELIVNTYWHSWTLLAIKRANRWFPVIEPILKKNNIPDDFKYLALIESGFEHVTSSAGAVGFWQFTEFSAKQYGLEVNNEVDERYNVEKSTQAACDYLKYAYSKFNNWTLSAASYNFGISGIERQIDRQKETNYYKMLFGIETSRYVFRILAMKEILSNPTKYGYKINKEDLYIPLTTYEISVDSTVKDLSLFARQKGINYKTLKYFNPWLRDNVLTNKTSKTYYIKLPKEGSI